jgi:hypothetical protein
MFNYLKLDFTGTFKKPKLFPTFLGAAYPGRYRGSSLLLLLLLLLLADTKGSMTYDPIKRASECLRR